MCLEARANAAQTLAIDIPEVETCIAVSNTDNGDLISSKLFFVKKV